VKRSGEGPAPSAGALLAIRFRHNLNFAMEYLSTKQSLSALALPFLLASCAAQRPPDPLVPQPALDGTAAARSAEPPAAQPVGDYYGRIEGHAKLYEEGFGLIAAGEEVLGESRIAPAASGLMADAEACAAAEGCDVRPFFEAFERLLTGQGILLKQQVVRNAELERSALEDVDREPGTAPFAAQIDGPSPTMALLHGTDLREIIRLNGPVKAAIADWLTWMRPMLIDAYWNYRFLEPKMAPVYEEAGLPEALLFAMLATESGGKVHAYSRAGAAGPLQFITSTGRRYGLRVVDGFDERLDPQASTRANVAYLNDQIQTLGGSLELALAAYNGGEGRMQGLHRRHGGNLWDGKIYYSLPSETREYVPRILAAAWLFLHPAEYGLQFPDVDSETTMLELSSDIAINELAICLGPEQNKNGWFRTLRNLNPRLNPGDRVQAGERIEFPVLLLSAYEKRCVEGPDLARARELNEASHPAVPEAIEYVVRNGDTLGRIASRFRCASLGELAELNRVRPPGYVIREGQVLRIPACK